MARNTKMRPAATTKADIMIAPRVCSQLKKKPGKNAVNSISKGDQWCLQMLHLLVKHMTE